MGCHVTCGIWHLLKLQRAPFLGPQPRGCRPLADTPQLVSSESCFHGKRILGKMQDAAHQLWKLCTEVCFWDSRRSSSRMALMSEAEEWPGWRSSVELVA